MTFTPPQSLIDEILSGNCIAFVGAGFSAAANLPQWGPLLLEMARSGNADPSVAAHIEERVACGTAHALDEAAQALEDAIGRAQLVASLCRQLGHPAPTQEIRDRVRFLRGIPFRAVLTTNFDSVLSGSIPNPDAYRSVLRPEGFGWWEHRYWKGDDGAFTLKLHGDLSIGETDAAEIVLTRRDYRRRLYHDAAYSTFLRAVMATRTVLYLGFSFEDAYLNEVRSEILSLIGQGTDSAPVAYAVINDVAPNTRHHFKRHEGIEILSYDTHGQTNFGGFDDWLKAFHDATNPLARFGRHLGQRRILWVDPHPENNAFAFSALQSAAELAGRPDYGLVTTNSADEGIRHLQEAAQNGAPFDLVITHWGNALALDATGTRIPAAVHLLSEIRTHGLLAPTIIFGAPSEIELRKRIALSLGALRYCYRFDDLFREIEAVFGTG